MERNFHNAAVEFRNSELKYQSLSFAMSITRALAALVASFRFAWDERVLLGLGRLTSPQHAGHILVLNLYVSCGLACLRPGPAARFSGASRLLTPCHRSA